MSGVGFVFLITVVACSSSFVGGGHRGGVATPSNRFDHFGAGYFVSAIFDQISDAITSEQCRSQLIRHREHTNNFTLWAIQMLDASSKLPSGILGGSIYHLGNFDECLAVDNGETGDTRITGKYCIATVVVTPSLQHSSKCEGSDARSCSAWDKLQVSSNRMKLQRNRLQIAVCIPSACTGPDLQQGLKFLDTQLQTVSIKTEVDESMCQTANLESEKWLSLFWCAVILYASFLLAFDKLLVRNKKNGTPATVCDKAFSVRSHWQHLTSLDRYEEDKDSIGCIHGMRVFSMIVIVMGHRGEALTAGPLVNGDAIEEMYEDFVSIMAMNGHLIVDVFFTISGFLISWNLLRQLETGKKINVVLLYFYRYLRLTPALTLVIAFEALVLFDLSSGPLWKDKVGRERDNCRNNWWTNLLYVNNYVRPEHPCVDPAWYLACDMQMFLVAPFVVLGLKKWVKNGFIVLICAIVTAIIIPFAVTYMGDLDPTIIPDPSTLGHSTENYTYVSVYVTAYCRAGPYFVGMTFAYWLHSMKSTGTKISQLILWSGWILGPLAQFAMLAAAVVFYQPDHQLSKFSIALYAALHRTLFSVGVGFSITACAMGQGGIVNRLLSWNRLRPFSRLTYSVFLCHTVVQMYHFGSIRTQMFMSYTDIVWLSISDLVLSVVFASVLYLAVERPVMILAIGLVSAAKNKRTRHNSNSEISRPEENGKTKSGLVRDLLPNIVEQSLAQMIDLERDNKKRG